jgi:predicted secreted protein
MSLFAIAFLAYSLGVAQPSVHLKYRCFAYAKASMQTTNVLTIHESDAGKSFQVRSDTLVKIKLPVQLGTGYSWRLGTNQKEHQRVLEQMDSVVEAAPRSNEVGQAETKVFTFRALARGAVTLNFEYARSWEKEPRKKFTVTINVKDALPGGDK